MSQIRGLQKYKKQFIGLVRWNFILLDYFLNL